MGMKQVAGRRGFIKQTAAMTAGLAGFGMPPGSPLLHPTPAQTSLDPSRDTPRKLGRWSRC